MTVSKHFDGALEGGLPDVWQLSRHTDDHIDICLYMCVCPNVTQHEIYKNREKSSKSCCFLNIT